MPAWRSFPCRVTGGGGAGSFKVAYRIFPRRFQLTTHRRRLSGSVYVLRPPQSVGTELVTTTLVIVEHDAPPKITRLGISLNIVKNVAINLAALRLYTENKSNGPDEDDITWVFMEGTPQEAKITI